MTALDDRPVIPLYSYTFTDNISLPDLRRMLKDYFGDVSEIGGGVFKVRKKSLTGLYEAVGDPSNLERVRSSFSYERDINNADEANYCGCSFFSEIVFNLWFSDHGDESPPYLI